MAVRAEMPIFPQPSRDQDPTDKSWPPDNRHSERPAEARVIFCA
jgi:hypothetical protein